MQRLTITIPKCYNTGREMSEYEFQYIQGTLMDLFGGYSRVEVFGQWTDSGGDIYTDKSFRYEILTGFPHHLRDLENYAGQLCRDLDQKCILTTCEDVQVDFVTG